VVDAVSVISPQSFNHFECGRRNYTMALHLFEAKPVCWIAAKVQELFDTFRRAACDGYVGGL